MKKLKMKKLSVMAMVMAVMLSMTACGSQKTAKENNQGTEQESSAVQVTPTESKTAESSDETNTGEKTDNSTDSLTNSRLSEAGSVEE